MAKTVVSPSMVAHLWAAQTQANARTSDNTTSFDGGDLYSYAMKIASIINIQDISVVLFNAAASHRSNTTSRHMGHAKSATTQYVHRYTVPHINPVHDVSGRYHTENVRFLMSQYEAAVDRYMKALNPRYWNSYGRSDVLRAHGDIDGYCMMFDLPKPSLAVNDDCDKIDARFVRLAEAASDPKKVAARAKREAKREALQAEKDRLAALTQAEQIEAWLSGAKVTLPHSGFNTPSGGVYLRVVKETLETSKGAVVPLSEAVTVFKIVDGLLNSLRITTTFSLNRRCGLFYVDCVYPNGNIKAGCHLIEYAEMLRIAKQLGLELRGIDSTEAVQAM